MVKSRFPLHPPAEPKPKSKDPEFSIADTGRFAWGKNKKNVLGNSSGGYDPYDTGVYTETGVKPRKKPTKDLRKLSEWIKAKRSAEQTSAEEREYAEKARRRESEDD